MAYSVSFQIRPSIQMKQIFHCASTSQVFTSENASPSRQATSSSIYLTRKPCFRFTTFQPRAALTFRTDLSARASRVLGKYAFSASRHPDPKTLTPKPDLYRSPSPKVWQFSKGWPSAPYFHQIQVQALTQLIPAFFSVPTNSQPNAKPGHSLSFSK